jgi:hypothetical protein
MPDEFFRFIKPVNVAVAFEMSNFLRLIAADPVYDHRAAQYLTQLRCRLLTLAGYASATMLGLKRPANSSASLMLWATDTS